MELSMVVFTWSTNNFVMLNNISTQQTIMLK